MKADFNIGSYNKRVLDSYSLDDPLENRPKPKQGERSLSYFDEFSLDLLCKVRGMGRAESNMEHKHLRGRLVSHDSPDAKAFAFLTALQCQMISAMETLIKSGFNPEGMNLSELLSCKGNVKKIDESSQSKDPFGFRFQIWSWSRAPKRIDDPFGFSLYKSNLHSLAELVFLKALPVDFCSSIGITLLHGAIITQDCELVRLLLSQGASCLKPCGIGWTNIQDASMFCRRTGDRETYKEGQTTCISLAIASKNACLVQVLMRHVKEKFHYDKDKQKLHQLLNGMSEDTVISNKWVKSRGMYEFITTRKRAPIHIAISTEIPFMLKALLDFPCLDIEQKQETQKGSKKECEPNFEYWYQSEKYPVHLASQLQDTDNYLALLLEKGASINKATERKITDGRLNEPTSPLREGKLTPLHIAASQGCLGNFELLMRQHIEKQQRTGFFKRAFKFFFGSTNLINARTSIGSTPLHNVCIESERGNFQEIFSRAKMTSLLCGYGADIHATLYSEHKLPEPISLAYQEMITAPVAFRLRKSHPLLLLAVVFASCVKSRSRTGDQYSYLFKGGVTTEVSNYLNNYIRGNGVDLYLAMNRDTDKVLHVERQLKVDEFLERDKLLQRFCRQVIMSALGLSVKKIDKLPLPKTLKNFLTLYPIDSVLDFYQLQNMGARQN